MKPRLNLKLTRQEKYI